MTTRTIQLARNGKRTPLSRDLELTEILDAQGSQGLTGRAVKTRLNSTRIVKLPLTTLLSETNDLTTLLVMDEEKSIQMLRHESDALQKVQRHFPRFPYQIDEISEDNGLNIIVMTLGIDSMTNKGKKDDFSSDSSSIMSLSQIIDSEKANYKGKTNILEFKKKLLRLGYIAESYDLLHTEHRLAHNDAKPDHILFIIPKKTPKYDRSEEIQLIDFGCVLSLDTATLSEALQPTTIIYTNPHILLDYAATLRGMQPKHSNIADILKRKDRFAFGLSAYKWLTLDTELEDTVRNSLLKVIDNHPEIAKSERTYGSSAFSTIYPGQIREDDQIKICEIVAHTMLDYLHSRKFDESMKRAGLPGRAQALLSRILVENEDHLGIDKIARELKAAATQYIKRRTMIAGSIALAGGGIYKIINIFNSAAYERIHTIETLSTQSGEDAVSSVDALLKKILKQRTLPMIKRLNSDVTKNDFENVPHHTRNGKYETAPRMVPESGHYGSLMTLCAIHSPDEDIIRDLALFIKTGEISEQEIGYTQMRLFHAFTYFLSNADRIKTSPSQSQLIKEAKRHAAGELGHCYEYTLRKQFNIGKSTFVMVMPRGEIPVSGFDHVIRAESTYIAQYLDENAPELYNEHMKVFSKHLITPEGFVRDRAYFNDDEAQIHIPIEHSIYHRSINSVLAIILLRKWINQNPEAAPLLDSVEEKYLAGTFRHDSASSVEELAPITRGAFIPKTPNVLPLMMYAYDTLKSSKPEMHESRKITRSVIENIQLGDPYFPFNVSDAITGESKRDVKPLFEGMLITDFYALAALDEFIKTRREGKKK